ncbi:hypothetical protein [Spirosoma harenae]
MNKELVLFTIMFAFAVFAGGLLLYWFRQIAFARRCPICHDIDVERRSRKGWLRHIPFAKAYFCEGCGTRFIRIGFSQSTKHRPEPPLRLMRDEPKHP